MPTRRIFFILLIVMSAGLLTLLWPMIPPAQQASSHRTQETNLSKDLPVAKEADRKPSPAAVSAEILKEAHLAGMIDTDPNTTEKRLDNLARNLTDAEINSMAEIVKTRSMNGDLRALAADLLVRNQSTSALKPLEKIIISTWPDSIDLRSAGFEQSLRARAIEGLESHPSPQATENLRRALSQVQDTFINDHGQRALLHRQGQARSVEEQDNEALQKILKR